jgi:hypothetical protein
MGKEGMYDEKGMGTTTRDPSYPSKKQRPSITILVWHPSVSVLL